MNDLISACRIVEIGAENDGLARSAKEQKGHGKGELKRVIYGHLLFHTHLPHTTLSLNFTTHIQRMTLSFAHTKGSISTHKTQKMPEAIAPAFPLTQEK